MANIRVIDDDKEVCKVLQYALETEGHTVKTAQNTQNLPTLLTPKPDLIFLDVLMPDAHGLEVLSRIQTLSPSSPIVIITGVNDYRLADLFYESGVAGFLTKPIHLKMLFDTVRRVLEQEPAACASEGGKR